MSQKLISLIMKAIAIGGLVTGGLIGANAGLAWGAFILTVTLIVLMIVGMFVAPPPFPWNREGAWLYVAGTIVLAIIFFMLTRW